MVKGNKAPATELTLKRLLDAPRELVWEVWTNARHLKNWWGPKGFSNPVCDWDAHTGNKIYIDMKGPDGTVYPMDGEFLEIVKPEKLVFISAALDKDGKRLFEVHNTILFKEKDGKTEMALHAVVSKIQPGAEQYLDGMNAGWNQTIDRLNDYMSMGNRELVFERMLNAPRELVWEVWTNPDHLAKWWGPNGFSLTTQNMNVNQDGVWKFIMHGPDGRDYPNKIRFLEVTKPERLVYRHEDDIDTEPVSFGVTVLFEAVGKKTKLSMRMLFESAEDLVRVSREYGAIEGAHQTLTRLENLVIAMQK
jgi:uncharacterized protein YndB with AHSA1/START domain